MPVSRQPYNARNQSSDDEVFPEENRKPKMRAAELRILSRNKQLEELISSFDDYSTVDLSCKNVTDADMTTVLKYAVLEKKCRILNLWGNQLTANGVLVLADILKQHGTVRELDLSNNFLSDEGVKIISEVLSLNTCLIKDIDLSSNGLSDEGVGYIADMLRKNPRLKILSLNDNEISNNGLILLANALVNNTELKQLKIESNPFITRQGVESSLKVLKHNKTLVDMYLNGCSVPVEEIQALLIKLDISTDFFITL